MTIIRKDPGATLDYQFDWADWLSDGDLIDGHDVTVGSGLTKVSSAIDPDATSVTVWLSGGSARSTVPVVCRVTTVGGRVDERTMTIRVEER